MKTIRFLLIILTGIFINSCAILKDPIITKNDSIEKYKYVFIPKKSNLTSGTGGVYGNQNGTFGYSTSKSVNPKDVISGILLKNGFVILPELKSELTTKTVIVNYGESGKRMIAGGLGGYTIEVTIKFISAETYEVICSCTAEGQGSTEADDIREAITRCLESLLSKEN
jgi:hypothetical protein